MDSITDNVRRVRGEIAEAALRAGRKPEDICLVAASKTKDAQAVREAIRVSLPEAQERISWSMPTYWKGRNIIHFAASKKHLGIYPGDEATAAFAEELSGYDISKGTIRIPYDQPLPEELIRRIAQWCFEKYSR